MSDTREQHTKVLGDLAADHRHCADVSTRDREPDVAAWFRTRQLACEAGAAALRQQEQIGRIAALVNDYYNDSTLLSAAETLSVINDVLGKPMELTP